MLGGRISTWDEPVRRGPPHPHQSLLGNCLYNFCTTLTACADFFCCCWLIRGCLGGAIGPFSSGPPPPPDPLLPPHGGRRFDFSGEQQQQPIQFGAPFGQPGPAPAQFGPSPLL